MPTLRPLIGAALLVAAIAIAPAPVAAKSGDIVRTGNCSGAADWKLKAGKDDGRIEVEFRWTPTASARSGACGPRQRRARIAGRRTTRPRPGRSRSTEDREHGGPDHIVARARNLVSGQLSWAP